MIPLPEMVKKSGLELLLVNLWAGKGKNSSSTISSRGSSGAVLTLDSLIRGEKKQSTLLKGLLYCTGEKHFVMLI